MATLLEVLMGGLQYDPEWEVWAELVGGEFRPESPARIGRTQYENGGMLDECVCFADAVGITDFIANYLNGLDDEASAEYLEEAARALIDEVNADRREYERATSKQVVISVDLGAADKGRARKEALERIAAREGHEWGGKPSIGRWIVSVADKEIEKEDGA